MGKENYNGSKQSKGLGAALGAILGSCSNSDLECLIQLKEHGVITEQEYGTISKRLNKDGSC